MNGESVNEDGFEFQAVDLERAKRRVVADHVGAEPLPRASSWWGAESGSGFAWRWTDGAGRVFAVTVEEVEEFVGWWQVRRCPGEAWAREVFADVALAGRDVSALLAEETARLDVAARVAAARVEWGSGGGADRIVARDCLRLRSEASGPVEAKHAERLFAVLVWEVFGREREESGFFAASEATAEHLGVEVEAVCGVVDDDGAGVGSGGASGVVKRLTVTTAEGVERVFVGDGAAVDAATDRLCAEVTPAAEWEEPFVVLWSGGSRVAIRRQAAVFLQVETVEDGEEVEEER